MTSNIPFRIRIGITGHRQLPDEEKLSEKITQVLKKDIFDLFDEDSKKLNCSSPYTPIAFSILTPLAEGADRLVAKEVLKIPNSRIEVVLPLSKEDYLKDFESQESLKEFEELFSMARRPIVLRKRTLREKFSEGELKDARRQAYEDVGRYIVGHCDVMIALWDGKPSRAKGGTAEIVEYACEKNRPVIIISTNAPYDISVLKGQCLNAQSVSGIEAFNTFSVSEKERHRYIENVFNDLFKTEEGQRISEESKGIIREKLLPFYVRASQIAKHNQRLYYRAGVSVYLFSAFAVAAVALGVVIHGLSFYAFSIELLLLLTILGMVSFSHKRKAHKNWVECRFLAERIRSAIYFAACGVEVSPIQVPPYMGIAHSPDDWMVRVFHEIWNRTPRMKGCEGQFCEILINFIRKLWIEDQIKYHEEKSLKSEKINNRLEKGGIIIFGFAVAFASLHIVGYGILTGWAWDASALAAISLPAFGAAIGGIRTHREFSRLAKRSHNMAAVLREMDSRFSGINKPEVLEALLREVEELMLRETQDWLMLMRLAKLEASA